MDINELKPNSHKSREASADQNSERKIKKVEVNKFELP